MSKTKSPSLLSVNSNKDLAVVLGSALLLLTNLVLCKSVISDSCQSINANGLRILVSLVVMYFILRSGKWLLLNKLIELLLLILVIGLLANILVVYYLSFY